MEKLARAYQALKILQAYSIQVYPVFFSPAEPIKKLTGLVKFWARVVTESVSLGPGLKAG